MPARAYFANERQTIHRHAETRLIVVLSGSFREEALGAVGAFESGDILLRPPFASHGDFASRDGARYLQFTAPPGLLKRRDVRNCWRAMRGRLNLARDDVRRTLQSRNAAAFIAEKVHMNAYVNFDGDCPLQFSAVRLAQDASIGISELAAKLTMRPDLLSKRFKMRFGLAPRAYASAARLERAMAGLALGAGSAAEIAASCGFFDQSHMSRAFQQAINMTPLEFHRYSSA